jgi:hypothetical protein
LRKKSPNVLRKSREISRKICGNLRKSKKICDFQKNRKN